MNLETAFLELTKGAAGRPGARAARGGDGGDGEGEGEGKGE